MGGFLDFEGKTFAVFGVANKKSVGFHVGRVLTENGAKVLYVVHTEERRDALKKRLPDHPIYVCDVAVPKDVDRVVAELTAEHPTLHGFVHAIAFANYSEGARPFHEVPARDFLEAMQISCHSLVDLARALKPHLDPDASVVTISISTTRMAAENYGYMAPVKAALDSSVVFLAKSFAADTRIRFNCVNPGLLKTNSAAGIPGYVDSYLYAEQVIPRGTGLKTEEVANTVAFLLSSASSGINAQQLVIDAGMSINYFDRSVVQKVVK